MSLIGAVAAAMGGYARVSISDENISDSTFSPANSSASYQLTSSGAINSITASGGTTSLGNWITPTSAAGANYEVRATEDSGSVTSGTIGSWETLDTTHTWTLTRTAVGSANCTLTIEIRLASSGAVLDTATITLEANKEA